MSQANGACFEGNHALCFFSSVPELTILLSPGRLSTQMNTSHGIELPQRQRQRQQRQVLRYQVCPPDAAARALLDRPRNPSNAAGQQVLTLTFGLGSMITTLSSAATNM